MGTFNFIKNSLRPILRRVLGRGGYKPQEYWADRLRQFGPDLRGPGHGGLSEEENARLYEQGEQALARLSSEIRLDWRGKFAEIGIGNGYWTRWLKNQGVVQYTGYDLSDVLFALVHKNNPSVNLVQLDVTKQKIADEFDTILMIDVTQHIVSEKRFQFAMQNCHDAIRSGGHFIVTSWLQPHKQISDYEVMRPLEFYNRHFAGWKVTGPIAFRDKFLFAFSRPA